ncbi:hypothetical protein AB0N09_02040 [Streptomyces erythrochromogenes]|uniref:hypothetical protein n=1 Tax=Streptomyces erythrochromogenes TaxID=285574 RepID=UPI00342521B1
MPVSADEARKDLFRLIERVNDDHVPANSVAIRSTSAITPVGRPPVTWAWSSVL